MKFLKAFTIVAFMVLGLNSFAQKTDSSDSDNPAEHPLVETMPVYPGGDEAMYKFLQKISNIRRKKGKKGYKGKSILNSLLIKMEM